MRNPNTTRAYHHGNIRNRLATLQRKTRMADTTRQTIQNEMEATALYWFLQGGGTEADFEKLFNT